MANTSLNCSECRMVLDEMTEYWIREIRVTPATPSLQCTNIVRVLTLAADLGETLFFILLEQQAKNLILRSIYIEHQSIK